MLQVLFLLDNKDLKERSAVVCYSNNKSRTRTTHATSPVREDECRTFVRTAFPSARHNSQDDITRSHFKAAVFHPLSEKLYHREKNRRHENIRKSGVANGSARCPGILRAVSKPRLITTRNSTTRVHTIITPACSNMSNYVLTFSAEHGWACFCPGMRIS